MAKGWGGRGGRRSGSTGRRGGGGNNIRQPGKTRTRNSRGKKNGKKGRGPENLGGEGERPF